MKKAGDMVSDIGTIECHRCQYESAAIRKNKKGYLYVHCYACGPDIGMNNKLCQNMITKRGHIFSGQERGSSGATPVQERGSSGAVVEPASKSDWLNFADDNE